MRLYIIAIIALGISPVFVAAQNLPSGATVLEGRNLTGNRKLVLWMAHAEKHPYGGYGGGDTYTCPDMTRGSFYSGDLRVTLENAKSGRIINTINVKGNGDSVDASSASSDPIDIPYLIRSGNYYYVPKGSTKVERKPQIINFKDFNGDGKALEFAFFDAPACMGLSTTLIGYSEKRDRVIQYPMRVKTSEGTTTEYWLDYLFYERPTSPMHWRYEIDYRGRGGTLDIFTVRYNPKSETFNATIQHRQ